MCGIFGFVNTTSLPNPALNGGLLSRGTRMLAHRGPDAEGLLGIGVDGSLHRTGTLPGQPLRIGLGHRRLSILDLSAAGLQPMSGPNDTWVIHNGEIYNYLELREELEQIGCRFQTGTDTEVILAAYAVWGESCVSRFNGMWAFALYDPRRGCLFLSRDRLGIKPLYYFRKNGLFAFASEVAPLLAMPSAAVAVDGRKLIRWLVDKRIDDGETTIYRDVLELRGGHNLRLDLKTGELTLRRFWDLPTAPDLELSEQQALDQFSELIEDALRLRLRSDVPVSLTLSGGVDSSVLAVAASRVRGRSICAFTSRFPEQLEIDESDYARAVTRACGIEHELIEPSLAAMVNEEPSLTRHQAMPYGTLSLYVHWTILHRIRALGFPVVLSGQGGDENFLGYERYLVTPVLAALPNLAAAATRLVQAGLHSRLGIGKMSAFVPYFASPWLQRQHRLRPARRCYDPALLASLAPPEPNNASNVREVQGREIRQFPLPNLLRYDDRTSAALGMETRLPFLDYRLVEFAFRLPLHLKIRNGWTKYLLRRYLAQHVPATVVWRRNKLGFNAPDRLWTDMLVRQRGQALQAHPFATGLFRRPLELSAIEPAQRWAAYNVLHLAALLDWEWAE